MKVVDLHPEELIDKLADGSLTFGERERLDAHLVQCSSCRLEMAVRCDLAVDAPAFLDRPQLTFAGDQRRDGVAGAPGERPARQASRSIRSRSRHRWALAMLAAALVLCAGGAMAAVITGAVSGDWLRWAPKVSLAESSAPVSHAKPALKVKRIVAGPASTLAPASEPVETSASSVAADAIAAPTPVVVANPSAPRARRTEATRAAPENARARVHTASSAAFAAAPVAVGSADVSATRVDSAAALFVDANRARRDGNLDRAVTLYRALQSRYPSSSEAELSRALLAQLLLDRGNPEAALAGFDRYLTENSPVLGAEALVGRARALEQMGKSSDAAAAWRQVQSRFPGSVHARLAATRLAALGMR